MIAPIRVTFSLLNQSLQPEELSLSKLTPEFLWGRGNDDSNSKHMLEKFSLLGEE